MSKRSWDPYYEDELVTLYLGDSTDFPCPEHVPLRIITDPPYGTAAYVTDTELEFPSDWFERADTIALFGWPEVLVRWCLLLKQEPTEWVTWWPQNKPPAHFSALLPRESEAVAIFGETMDARVLKRPRTPSGPRLYTKIASDPEWARLGDVWTDFAPGTGFNARMRLHPNEKPVSLMVKLVTLCSDRGSLVYDPFAGSGTTLVAAKQLGRSAIGVEIDEKHCEQAALRCSQEAFVIDETAGYVRGLQDAMCQENPPEPVA